MIKAIILSFTLLTISCKDKVVSNIETNTDVTEVTLDPQIGTESEPKVKSANSEAELESNSEKTIEINNDPKPSASKIETLKKQKASNTNDAPVTTNKEVDSEPTTIDKEERPELPPVYVEPTPKPVDDIPVVEVDEEKTPAAKYSHDVFNKVLTKYVSANGKVNYNSLKANRSDLDSYTKSLMDNPPAPNWTKNEQLAYWINAYNAFTITKIVDNYPLKSIKDLDGGKPWDAKWIKIGSKTYSLNNIENDIIRPKFNDPRIHFAVNCAAKSCPPLLNKAYTAANLNSLLNSNTKKFINNNKFNDLSGSQLKLSKIFDWYGSDFGNLIDFLNKYSDTKIEKGTDIGYMEYNWSLNN